jgi:hypothetical protein
MKWMPWFFAAVLPIAAAGWAGAFVGQFAVALVTIGIFVSTLSLGRERVKIIAVTGDAQSVNT